jgi:hypothetical protein
VFDAFASWLQALPLALVGNFTRVLLHPLGAGQRVYWLYHGVTSESVSVGEDRGLRARS